ncbi:NADP/FAD dependent oxidoreductase [Cadophora sp. MPI-SDFR-AT-0126]|nr:NADP/FAD dependent oxidoreductase [Leotiomycetes sp. MPI-SDFR-AT-0126]
MASFQSSTIPTDTLPQIAAFLTPTSTPDIFALVAVTLGSVGYLLNGIAWNKPDPHASKLFRRPQLLDGASIVEKKENRNVAKKLEDHNKDVVIFWGSQSGTAEGIANRLGRELHLRFGLGVLVADLSDYDADTIALIPETKFAIFIMSTYGEGDPSDNTSSFWEWIHKTTDVSLCLRYAAFGLGNSNYKYFNRVIDVTVDTLDKFGAQAIMPVYKADDAEGGTEEDFMAWKAHLFEVLQSLGVRKIEATYIPTFEIVADDSLMPIDLHDGEPTQHDSAKTCSPIRALKVLSTRELFESKDRNCLHMDLDLSEDPDLHYKTGDHLAIWPMNPEEEVQLLLKTLNLADSPITIKSLDTTVKVRIPTPTSISTLCRNYLEICAPVSREAILSLSSFAPTKEAKAFLDNLGKDKELFSEFLHEHYLTIGRVMAMACPTLAWNVPLSFLIESLPHLQPRYYSISSSSVISPRQPSITALVAKTPLPSGEVVQGVASNYLLALSQSQTHAYQFPGPSQKLESGKVFAHIRKSKFKLPVQASCPLIMIAAGTGLAPFMAFLSEKKKLMDIGKVVGQMILFYGCRDSGDFIYRQELEEFMTAFNGKLTLVTAFSRTGQKVYVQGRIAEKYDEVMGLIGEGANLYICGRANMAKDVERVLGEKMKLKRGWGEAELNEWSRKLKGTRKWQEDVWG